MPDAKGRLSQAFQPQQMKLLLSIKTVFLSPATRSGTTVTGCPVGRFLKAIRLSTMRLWV